MNQMNHAAAADWPKADSRRPLVHSSSASMWVRNQMNDDLLVIAGVPWARV
jgi:hypothetical protein